MKTKSEEEIKVPSNHRFYKSMINKVKEFIGKDKEHKSTTAYIENAIRKQLHRDCARQGVEQWKKGNR